MQEPPPLQPYDPFLHGRGNIAKQQAGPRAIGGHEREHDALYARGKTAGEDLVHFLPWKIKERGGKRHFERQRAERRWDLVEHGDEPQAHGLWAGGAETKAEREASEGRTCGEGNPDD